MHKSPLCVLGVHTVHDIVSTATSQHDSGGAQRKEIFHGCGWGPGSEGGAVRLCKPPPAQETRLQPHPRHSQGQLYMYVYVEMGAVSPVVFFLNWVHPLISLYLYSFFIISES